MDSQHLLIFAKPLSEGRAVDLGFWGRENGPEQWVIVHVSHLIGHLSICTNVDDAIFEKSGTVTVLTVKPRILKAVLNGAGSERSLSSREASPKESTPCSRVSPQPTISTREPLWLGIMWPCCYGNISLLLVNILADINWSKRTHKAMLGFFFVNFLHFF